MKRPRQINIFGRSLCLLCLCLFYQNEQSVADINQGLIGHWPLDESSPALTAPDLSPSDSDGTLVNMDPDTAWVNGYFGNSLHFIGGQDLVRLGSAGQLSPTQAISLSVWVYKQAPGDLIHKMYSISSRANGYALTTRDDKVTFWVGSGTAQWKTVTTAQSIPLNQWVHVVATYDGDTMKVYLNGVEDVAQTNSQLMVEAEEYDALHSGSGSYWWMDWSSTTSTSGYTGTSAMRTSDSGRNSGDSENGPEMEYQVNFPNSGSYYVWARVYFPHSNSNSIHVGINDTPVTYGSLGLSDAVYDSWHWVGQLWDGQRVSISVPSAGTHTVSVWMREDGTLVDSLLFTQDVDFVPGSGASSSEDIYYDDLTTQVTTLSTGSADPIDSLNPLAYLQLSESSGGVAQDSQNTYPGQYQGNPSLNGQFVDLDGNDYVEIPYHALLSSENGSVSLWFNPDSTSGRQHLISKDASGFGTGGHLSLYLENNRLTVRHQNTSQSVYFNSNSGAYSTGAWHHLVYSWSSLGRDLFLDGQWISGERHAIEAEHYDRSTSGSGSASGLNWFLSTSRSGYEGSGYMTTSNTGVNVGHNSNGPQLEYDINFTQTGTYYVWARLNSDNSSSNSVHFGLDGTPVTFQAQGFSNSNYDVWDWHDELSNGHAVTIDVSTPGIHTLNMWMREDGTAVDKIMVVQDSSRTPFTHGLNGNTNPFTLGAGQQSSAEGTTSPLNDYFNGQLAQFAYFNAPLTHTQVTSIYEGGGPQVSGPSYEGRLDEIRMYDRALTEGEVTELYQPLGASYFKVSHDGAGIHCLEESIGVAAYGSDDQIYTAYQDTITLDTQSGYGQWTLQNGQGTLNDLGNGQATYTFDPLDNGQATFYLRLEQGASDIDIAISDPQSIVDDDTHTLLTFSPSGFIVSQQAGQTLAFSQTQRAGNAFNMVLTAYGQDPQHAQCGVIETYTGVQSLKFWFNYVNPNSGTRAFEINGTPIASLTEHATPISVAFSQGIATVQGNYPDVGQIQLHVKDDSPLEPAQGILGASAPFVVKPFDLVIQQIENTRDPVAANPQASDHNGAQFVKSGEAFSVQVRVENAQGELCPNFGLESTSEALTLHLHQLVQPISGELGTLSNPSALTPGANAGEFEGDTFAYNEVGIIQLNAQIVDGDYLGQGQVSGTPSAHVGRFYPDHFTVTPVSIGRWQTTCGSFSYLGQPILFETNPSVSITAHAIDGSVVKNYRGDFWKLPDDLNEVYAVNAISGVSLDSSQTSASFEQSEPWKRVYQFHSGTGIVLNRPSTLGGEPIAPFDAELEISFDVMDQDLPEAVRYQSNPYRLGGTGVGQGIPFSQGALMRHGRMTVSNAMGSELENLELDLTTEYYQGNAFVQNELDQCSALPTLNVTLSPLDLSTSSTVTPAINAPPSHLYFYQGRARVVLSAPGERGFADIRPLLSGSPWLQFDWPHDPSGLDGIPNDDPNGRGSFGIFKGNTRIIYQHETP